MENNNVIDLTAMLDTSHRPQITINDKHFEVRNDKVVVFKLNEISKNSKIPDLAEKGDKTDEIIRVTLGDKALEYITAQRYSSKQLGHIVNAIIAFVTERPFEEVEKEAEEREKNPSAK